MVYVGSAKKTGIKEQGVEFQLSYEQFAQIVKQPCYYCGSSPRRVSGRRSIKRRDTATRRNIPSIYKSSGERIVEEDKYTYIYTTNMNGIDRVDNNKGYIKENVVPCCTTCNLWKKAEKAENFLSHVHKIAFHQRWIKG
jgi:hypothetical protein